jgi:hypothetical protein
MSAPTGRRRGGMATFSFFAFQDVITSVIGIIIVFTIMLSLQLDDSPPAPEAPLERNLNQTLEEIAKLRTELARLQADREGRDVAAGTAAEIRATEEKIAAYQRAIADLNARIAAMQDPKRGDLTRMRAEAVAEYGKLKEKEGKLQDQNNELQKLREALEAQVKAASDKVMARQQQSSVLRLIPEKGTASDKEPVLVVVTAQGFKMQRFDNSEVVAQESNSAFGGALSRLAKEKQFLVFYFKPSGCSEFERLVGEARTAGFEVGYDVVSEQVQLELAPPPS